jgi:Pyocin activator protein PrtN
MKTWMILMARYDGLAVILLDLVCRDYFRHLAVDKLLRKVMAGDIALPITRMEASQKAANPCSEKFARISTRQAWPSRPVQDFDAHLRWPVWPPQRILNDKRLNLCIVELRQA